MPQQLAAEDRRQSEQPQDHDGPPMQLDERQLELERYWHYFRAEEYSGHAVDWDGSPHVGKLERAAVVGAQYTPPGYVDVSGAFQPLKFRRPSAPARLGRVIVKRFSGLLFSTKRRPQVRIEGDRAGSAWLAAAVKETRYWQRWLQARDYGGAMGSAAVGFRFTNGRPVVEVHDPRWCRPTFRDKETGELARFEKKYVFCDKVRNHEGKEEDRWFWYRRVIDRQADTVWSRVPVNQYQPHEEPDWRKVLPRRVEHGFGFCPVVWVQNCPMDDVDGDPDCHGAFETIEEVDRLLAQASYGTLKNCDPTTVISTSAQMREVRKGSDNAIKLPDGSAQYMEMNGSGPKSARELASELTESVCRMCRVVLEDNMHGPARTDNEVTHNYSSMYEQADVLREQYGEAARLLLAMLCSAAASLQTPRTVIGADGLPQMQTSVVRLRGFKGKPPKPSDEGDLPDVELEWPDYFQPGVDQVGQAVQAAGQAKDFGLIGRKEAVNFVARHFGVDEPDKLAKQLDDEAEAASEKMMEQMTAGVGPSAGADEEGAQPNAEDATVDESAENAEDEG